MDITWFVICREMSTRGTCRVCRSRSKRTSRIKRKRSSPKKLVSFAGRIKRLTTSSISHLVADANKMLNYILEHLDGARRYRQAKSTFTWDKTAIFAFAALWMYVDIRRNVCSYYNVNVKGPTRSQPCLSYAYLNSQVLFCNVNFSSYIDGRHVVESFRIHFNVFQIENVLIEITSKFVFWWE